MPGKERMEIRADCYSIKKLNELYGYNKFDSVEDVLKKEIGNPKRVQGLKKCLETNKLD